MSISPACAVSQPFPPCQKNKFARKNTLFLTKGPTLSRVETVASLHFPAAGVDFFHTNISNMKTHHLFSNPPRLTQLSRIFGLGSAKENPTKITIKYTQMLSMSKMSPTQCCFSRSSSVSFFAVATCQAKVPDLQHYLFNIIMEHEKMAIKSGETSTLAKCAVEMLLQSGNPFLRALSEQRTVKKRFKNSEP